MSRISYNLCKLDELELIYFIKAKKSLFYYNLNKKITKF